MINNIIGDAQCSKYVLRNILLMEDQYDESTVQLYLNPATQTKIEMPDYSSWCFCLRIVARQILPQNGLDECWCIRGLIVKDKDQYDTTTIIKYTDPQGNYGPGNGIPGNLGMTPSWLVNITAEDNTLSIFVTIQHENDEQEPLILPAEIYYVACLETTEVIRERVVYV